MEFNPDLSLFVDHDACGYIIHSPRRITGLIMKIEVDTSSVAVRAERSDV